MSSADGDLAEFLRGHNIVLDGNGLANFDWAQDETIGNEVYRRALALSMNILNEEYRNDNEASADYKSIKLLGTACLQLLPILQAHLMDPLFRFAHSAYVNQSMHVGVAEVEFDHQCRSLLLKTELCQSYNALRSSMNETPPMEELIAGVFMIHSKTCFDRISDAITGFSLLYEHGEKMNFQFSESKDELIFEKALQISQSIRGMILQIEMVLPLLQPDQIKETVEMAQATITSALENLHPYMIEKSSLTFILQQTSFAQIGMFFRNFFDGSNLGINSVLEQLNRACLDGEALEPQDKYATLFAQFLRLRFCQEHPELEQDEANAIHQSQKALEEAMKMRSYNSYDDFLNRLINNEPINSIQLSDELSFSI
ncbi:hypothetical protein N9K73_03480 [Candidatus Poseidoniales archaeon]|nr:hypothetical protein [Candidatus Poseidoniales archaeon]